MSTLFKTSGKALTLVTLLSLSQPSIECSAEKSNFWQLLNNVGFVGSIASFAYWVHDLAMSKKDPLSCDALLPLVVDALSITGDAYNSNGTNLLNILCLLGSVGSLAVWGKSIIDHPHNSLHLARGALDTLQIVLALKRLHNPYRSPEQRYEESDEEVEASLIAY